MEIEDGPVANFSVDETRIIIEKENGKFYVQEYGPQTGWRDIRSEKTLDEILNQYYIFSREYTNNQEKHDKILKLNQTAGKKSRRSRRRCRRHRKKKSSMKRKTSK